MNGTLSHRHGVWVHDHHHHGPHRHARLPFRSEETATRHDEHPHSHGLVDPEIVRSRAGVRVVAQSLAVLATTALVQVLVFTVSGSVALLADLIHNAGDALTAIPLGLAFFAVNRKAERWAGYAVVGTIFVSACIAGGEALYRVFNPRPLDHLLALALAGAVGFIGNEIAAQLRLGGGRRLHSAALLADGHHARVDGFVSLGVVASAGAVALGFDVADPVIGLAISVLILRITLQAWDTIRRDDAS
jgi:cation diffusion facilitator family transporter